MAWPDVDLGRIADALPTILQDDIIETMNRSCPELQLIRYKPVSQKNLQWDVEFKNASESSNSALAEGANVSTFGDDDIVPAVLQFCDYSESIKLTGKAISGARGSAGKGAGASELSDLWSQKMLRAIRRLAKNIGRDFWTGPGTGNRMLGLYGGSTLTSGAPLAAAGTYAGIVRGTYADWSGNVLANGGVNRALSFDLMRAMRKEIYEACGEMPDLIMCDPTQHENYGKLFGDQRRYVQEITVRGQKIVLDGGYRALEFDGIPIICSVNHPANSMTFLNTGTVFLTALDDQPTEANRSPRMVSLQAMPEEQLQSGAVPFQARLNPLAVNGDAYPLQLILYPQIQVENPNRNGVLADLT
jgi:hypothetical protein